MLSQVYKVDENKLNNDLMRIKEPIRGLICSSNTFNNWESFNLEEVKNNTSTSGKVGWYKSIPIYINDDVSDGYIDIQ